MRGSRWTVGTGRGIGSAWQVVAGPLLVSVLAGCGLLLSQPEPGPPDGLPRTDRAGREIGRGESLGIQWRYLVYQSDMGFCTKIEGPGGSSCGGAVPGSDPAAGAVGLISIGSGTGAPSSIEGFATDEVDEVWIELRGGRRMPATLMPLAPAGHDGQLWLAFVPEGLAIEEATAIGADGEILGSQAVGGR